MTPEEAKIWIENEVAERFPFGSSSCLIKRRAATETATSLYQHLQENGRVSEDLIKDAIRFGADNVMVFSETDIQVEDLYEQFIKENPIYKP